MKTKWEEMRFMRPHAYMQKEGATFYSLPDETLCFGARYTESMTNWV